MKTKQRFLMILLGLIIYSTSFQKVISSPLSIDQILPYFEGVYSGINFIPTEKEDSGEFKAYVTESSLEFLKTSTNLGLRSLSFSKKHYPHFRSLDTEEWSLAWMSFMSEEKISDYFDVRAFEYPYFHPHTKQSLLIFFLIPKENYQHLGKAISVLHINGEFHATDEENHFYYKPKMFLGFEEKLHEQGLSNRIINNLNEFGDLIDRPKVVEEYAPHEKIKSSDRIINEGFFNQYLVPEDCSFYLLN